MAETKIYLGSNAPAKVSVSGMGATVIVGRPTSILASDVSIQDAGGYFDSTNVEGALQELGADIAGGVTTAAANVTIADAGGYYTSTDVEGALQEIGNALNSEDSNYLDPVLSFPSTPPIAPNTGDRYLVSGVASGAWAGQENKVATWNGASWDFYTPSAGDVVLVLNTLVNYRFNGTLWIVTSATALLQGGNNFTGDVLAGTNQPAALKFVTNATVRGEVTSAGDLEMLKSVKAVGFKSDIQTLSISAGLIAWNMANGQRAKVTLTGNATLSNPTNLGPAFPDLEVTQDGTGGHVLSFGTNFVLPDGYEAAGTAANSVTLYHFQLRSDGKLAVVYTYYLS